MLSTPAELVAAVTLIAGSAFLLLAGVALVRMPDLYTRVSASSKAVTAGAGLCLVAAGIALADTGVAPRAIAGIAFFLLTSPVAAHVVARTAVYVGVPFAERTRQPATPPGERDPLRSSR